MAVDLADPVRVVPRTISTTLGVLAGAEPVLERWAQFAWPPREAYTVRKLIGLVAQELRPWHEQRTAWIRELGEPDAQGGLRIPPARVPDFLRRLAEMADITVTLPWGPIPFAALDHAEDPTTHQPVKVPASDLLALGPLLDEPEG